jgi:single-strand DNA-binding protein
MLLGNLGSDPELTYTQGGTAKAKFSMCTNKSYKDKNSGEWQERAQWHNIICWGKTAETASKFLTKGRQALIKGEVESRSWDDKNTGEKKWITEIVVNEEAVGTEGKPLMIHAEIVKKPASAG